MSALAAIGTAPVPAGPPGRAHCTAGRAAALWRYLIGVAFCLTPLTAVIALGWLMRLMRAEEAAARRRLAGAAAPPIAGPRWVIARRGEARGPWRWIAALWANLREGAAALLTLAAGAAPFASLWLFAWWGGWENSFNKGYEQAWVGPALGLAGAGLATLLLARLPMALAHQAAEGRLSAFFAFGRIGRLMRAAGWRYVLLSAVSVGAMAPLSLATIAPVFIEAWAPELDLSDPEAVARAAGAVQLASAAYLFAVLTGLRLWAARLHARAAHRLSRADRPAGAVAWLGARLRDALVLAIWFGAVAQIFIAQFVNHAWIAWAQHPFWGLPWIRALG